MEDARHGAVWQAMLAPKALYGRVMHAMASTFLPVGYPHVRGHDNERPPTIVPAPPRPSINQSIAHRPAAFRCPPQHTTQSVREEYLAYQAWDTVQALCSYLRGILTTKAILEGVGVGSGG